MAVEINAGRHHGLTLGIVADESETFFNYGEHDGSPISEQNYFEIASTSKIFTSLLILRLISEGFLSLDDFVEKHIPEFSERNHIKIRDLILHTSGLGREPPSFESIAPQNSFLAYSEKMLLKDIENPKLNLSVIGKFSYSNFGYVLLGLIAKRVTKSRDFQAILLDYVLRPLDLTDFSFDLAKEKQSKLCWGHTLEGQLVRPYLDLGEVFASAGALITTTKELLKACNSLMRPETLNPVLREPVKQLFSVHRDSSKQLLSFGFQVRENESGNVFYHPGSIAGHKCSVLISPSQKKAIAYNTTSLHHVQPIWDIFEAR